jgi:hypothetical protein
MQNAESQFARGNMPRIADLAFESLRIDCYKLAIHYEVVLAKERVVKDRKTYGKRTSAEEKNETAVIFAGTKKSPVARALQLFRLCSLA